jgi:hypothetical protein
MTKQTILSLDEIFNGKTPQVGNGRAVSYLIDVLVGGQS